MFFGVNIVLNLFFWIQTDSVSGREVSTVKRGPGLLPDQRITQDYSYKSPISSSGNRSKPPSSSSSAAATANPSKVSSVHGRPVAKYQPTCSGGHISRKETATQRGVNSRHGSVTVCSNIIKLQLGLQLQLFINILKKIIIFPTLLFLGVGLG